MKKTIIVFGLISGIIISVFMLSSIAVCYGDADFQGNMIVGYAAMLLSLSFVFVGVKNYRDKYNGGVISFGKAFRVGLYIALIASTLYVLTWLVSYYTFFPDFMDKYTDFTLREARESGLGEAEIKKKVDEMAWYREMYQNPLFVILFTYFEILPVGLFATLVSALILKRKPKVNGELKVES